MKVLNSDVRFAMSPAFCGSLIHFDLKNCLSRLKKMTLNLPPKPTLQSTLLLVQSIPESYQKRQNC